MSGGHTPGPWKIEADRDPSARQEHPDHYFIQIGEIGKPDWRGSVSGHCGIANAHLIAAAPELLTELKYAVKLLEALPGFRGTAQVDAMQAAISKAEGRS